MDIGQEPVVFFTEHLEIGGAERQIVQLVESFRSEGIGLRLVVLEARGPWIVDALKPDDVVLSKRQDQPPPRGSLGQVRRFLRALRAMPSLRSTIRKERPRAVVTFLWFPTLLACLACLGMRGRPPLIWSLQSDLANVYGERPGGLLRHWLIRFLIVPRITGVVAISTGIKKRFADYSGCDERLVLLCPNAVDIGRMQRLATEPNVAFPRKADIRLLSVARLVPQKALDVLIQALSEIPRGEFSWECFLLGEGPLEKDLKSQAIQLGVADRITFVGSSENPAAWIASADIFVLPSAWEPFGIVLLEAMSLGIAVITSDSDGAREVVTDGKDALVFAAGDVEVLKDRLLELTRDGSRRSQLGENARRTATSYDSVAVAEIFGTAISSIVAAADVGNPSAIRVMDGLRGSRLWKSAKGKLRDTYFWDIGIWPLKAKNRRQWIRRGRPKKVPHLVKEKVVRAHTRSFGTRILVETGTFQGEMVSAMRNRFEQIYSIELHPELHQKAAERFRRFSHIQILRGDSARVLPEIAAEIQESCLFWLDAHYSGGITARGEMDTPISAELRTVLERRQSDVVLIDDSFDFNGSNGYPTLEELESAVMGARPDYDFTVSDYIIRITPGAE